MTWPIILHATFCHHWTQIFTLPVYLEFPKTVTRKVLGTHWFNCQDFVKKHRLPPVLSDCVGLSRSTSEQPALPPAALTKSAKNFRKTKGGDSPPIHITTPAFAEKGFKHLLNPQRQKLFQGGIFYIWTNKCQQWATGKMREDRSGNFKYSFPSIANPQGIFIFTS